MRVSDHYRLGLTQPQLDFVDVDTRDDTRLYVDPQALRTNTGRWAHECLALVQDFFEVVIESIRGGRGWQAEQLLAGLSEPNETRLGLSRGRAQGRGVGRDLAQELRSMFEASEAVKTGMLEDLEDSILLVHGIGL